MTCRLQLKFENKEHPRTCDQCSLPGIHSACPLGYRFIKTPHMRYQDFELVNKDNINNKGQLIGMDGIPCRLTLEPGLKPLGDKVMTVKLSTLENVKFLIVEIVDIQKRIDEIDELMEQQDKEHSNETTQKMEKEYFIGASHNILCLKEKQLTVTELIAILPIRKKSLEDQRLKLIKELEGFNVAIEIDGSLNTQLREDDDSE